MDLSKIKERLEALNREPQGNSGIDYAAVFWKPENGKSVVRIVPSKYDKDNPFTELMMHQVKGMFRGPVLALTNFGKQDPIEEFRQQLQNLGGKENWSLSGKIQPRARYFVPVIVRGEEDKGVRLWSIGVSLYKALLSLAADEEIGDFTDVVNGTDMIVERTPGNPYPETSIRPKRNSSPLSDDPAQVEKWLNDQPEPIKCFKQYDYDFIKKGLGAYLTGGTPAGSTEDKKDGDENPKQDQAKTVEQPKAVETAKPVEKKVGTFKVETAAKPAAAPKSITSKFDELFQDDEPVGSTEDDEDNLPF